LREIEDCRICRIIICGSRYIHLEEEKRLASLSRGRNRLSRKQKETTLSLVCKQAAEESVLL
jgi:hypothetical protein